MFLGEYVHTLDEKGRLTIPAKFRDELAHGLIVTRGLDGCLFIFTLRDWQRFAEGVREQFAFTRKSARDFFRFIFSGATDAVPDRQGRVLIPPALREYAQLDGEVVVIGNYAWVEVWNPERWAEVRRAVEENAELIAEQFSALQGGGDGSMGA